MSAIYVAGPMTGLPEYNYPAFNAAERRLRALGHDVRNPTSVGQHDGWVWADYMRCGLLLLMECGAVAQLPGWQNSRGAWLESEIARSLGMIVAPLDWWLS